MVYVVHCWVHRLLFIGLYVCGIIFLGFGGFPGRAQNSQTKTVLLNDPVTQFEITEAIQQMYNFKFPEAHKQFLALKVLHKEHPLPYFLFGLSTFWKITANDHNQNSDELFYAQMDTVITLAEKLYDEDEKNFEAIFFLAAAHGFKGRLYADRKHWTRATLSGKSALKYLELSREFNDLSPEFMYGEGLYNYYEEWIRENYPGLRPILWFFPNGDKKKGLEQLKQTAQNSFYARVESQVYLMRILSGEEGKVAEALPLAKLLYYNYPDNPYFERYYARCLFQTGQKNEVTSVAEKMLAKVDSSQEGYDEATGRYAHFYLGWNLKSTNPELAIPHFLQSMAAAEKLEATHMSYYFFSVEALAKIYENQNKVSEACKCYEKVLDLSSKKSDSYKYAKTYLKKQCPK